MDKMQKKIGAVILLLVFGVLMWFIAYRHDTHEVGQDMQMEVEEVSQPQAEEPEEPEAVIETEPGILYCDSVIDFEELQEENADIYAWIQIPGTVIEYPVLQSEEDNYYLDHNLDHSEGYPGCVYTNQCNTRDFSDFLTVLYGHNMKNGTMFTELHKFEDEDFFNNNDQILIYTEDARYTYQIYGAVAYGDGYIPAMFDVQSGEGVTQFDDSLRDYEDGRKLFREGLEVTMEDHLLILSTCIAKEDTKRYLVIGKLTETAFYNE